MLNRVHLIALLGAVLVGCTSAGTPQNEPATPTPTEVLPAVTLTISGSGSVSPILAASATGFEAANPGYTLEVLPGSGTGGGIDGVLNGTLDVAAMSRAARDSEAEQGIKYVPIGTSVTAVFVHPEVGVIELTGEQVKDIFVGNISNWNEVGGPDLDIVVYVRDPEEGNTIDMLETYLGEDGFAESAQVMTSQTDMTNVVASVKGAIGYGTWATAVANSADVEAVTIDGLGISSALDTLVVTMGIGYLANREDEMRPYVDWLQSEDGHAALTAISVVPFDKE